ncbi:MAG: EamA family transporter [Clostridia bacterium]|nr:EamA family transporter [Clostridia bacterium]
MGKTIRAILCALLAAVFYAVSTPCSKLLLQHIDPTYLAGFLYLGAGIGIGLLYLVLPKEIRAGEKLTRSDFPYVLGMIVLDIAAPILLLFGLQTADSSSAALLGNFEIVATALLALFLFREKISGRLWGAIGLITLSSILLSVHDLSGITLSYGSLLVLAATCCWGLENNCTRKISHKSTYEIVFLKGIFSGLGSVVIALCLRERFPQWRTILYAALLGFVAYGLSIFLYVRAQARLGAAKTSAYYAVAPFVGALLSFLLLGEKLSSTYLLALVIMIAGSALVVADTLLTRHTHAHVHTFTHTHDGSTHTHTVEHSHGHTHFVHEDEHGHTHTAEELEAEWKEQHGTHKTKKEEQEEK